MIELRSQVNAEVIGRPVKGYIMSCRDVLSKNRFGKQKSLVKVTCSSEDATRFHSTAALDWSHLRDTLCNTSWRAEDVAGRLVARWLPHGDWMLVKCGMRLMECVEPDFGLYRGF